MLCPGGPLFTQMPPEGRAAVHLNVGHTHTHTRKHFAIIIFIIILIIMSNVKDGLPVKVGSEFK